MIYCITNQQENFAAVCADCFDKPIRIEFHFLDDLHKCLIFDGPIKHDKFDMRSWSSYREGEKIKGLEGNWGIG